MLVVGELQFCDNIIYFLFETFLSVFTCLEGKLQQKFFIRVKMQKRKIYTKFLKVISTKKVRYIAEAQAKILA